MRSVIERAHLIAQSEVSYSEQSKVIAKLPL